MTGQFVVLRPVEAWVDQAEKALDDIRAANGGIEPPTIRDGHRIAPEAFSSLIESMVALQQVTGRPVSDVLVQLAGLRPIEELL